jgi:hypothetical protein
MDKRAARDESSLWRCTKPSRSKISGIAALLATPAVPSAVLADSGFQPGLFSIAKQCLDN